MDKTSYVPRTQYAPDDENASEIDKDFKHPHQIFGTLLYYALYVDCIMIKALNSTTKQQPKPTIWTYESITHILDYVETHPNVVVIYKESDIVLHVKSDASYRSEQKSQIRMGGHYFWAQYQKTSPNNLKTNQKWTTPHQILSATSCHSIICRNLTWSAFP